MDEEYLSKLIEETKKRDGGLILQQEGIPEAVVLTIEKYNQLILDIRLNLPADQVGIEDLKQEAKETEQPGFQSHNNKTILVTGGAGYIGSHASRELIKAGYEVIVLDNLSCGKRSNIAEGSKFIEGDVSDLNLLRDIFASNSIYAVMHFAASVEVEESVKNPIKYLQNNAMNTAALLSVMEEFEIKKFIFSSTAAVYGSQEQMPISEYAKLQPESPYGYSKLLAERIIKYYCHYMGLEAIVFRYFNACGCDFDGSIQPTHSTHIFSRLIEVAMRKAPVITVYGTDYETFDGSCIRDYVHVLDIARAHVLAVEKFDTHDQFSHESGYRIFNIGTGKGSSVLEVISKTSEAIGRIIPMDIGPRRPGDSVQSVADTTKIKKELGFELLFSDIETIAKTTWAQAQRGKSV